MGCLGACSEDPIRSARASTVVCGRIRHSATVFDICIHISRSYLSTHSIYLGGLGPMICLLPPNAIPLPELLPLPWLSPPMNPY